MTTSPSRLFADTRLTPVCQRLLEENPVRPAPVTIAHPAVTLNVYSNHPALLHELAGYFQPWCGNAESSTVIDVFALRHDAFELDDTFTPWPRETGKSGQKESYRDYPDGRLIYKHKTGMLFVQSDQYKLALGPVDQHPNQIINFVNNQYMNWLQQRDWLICHAAALCFRGQAIAIAAFSGGGKSTQMLHCLDHPEMKFLTNDRLFIKLDGQHVCASGIAKLPRINPGTIVHNPKLSPLISSKLKQELINLPPQELWHLEQKYDVNIDHIYGQQRIQTVARLATLIILNWTHSDAKPCTISPIDLELHPELLNAIVKSQGPFFQTSQSEFTHALTYQPDKDYLAALKQMAVFEVSGHIDFYAVKKFINEQLCPEWLS